MLKLVTPRPVLLVPNHVEWVMASIRRLHQCALQLMESLQMISRLNVSGRLSLCVFGCSLVAEPDFKIDRPHP